MRSASFTLGGFDTFNGRGGNDTADFSNFFQGAVWVDLTYVGFEAQTQNWFGVFQPLDWYNIADLSGIENLRGTAYDDYLGGDGLSNRLDGYFGANILRGNGGADQFVFNLAVDQLESSAQRDTIQDFTTGLDKIAIAGISSLPGFVAGTAPGPGSGAAALLYNTTTGVLSYDFDGTGAGAAIEIAKLDGMPSLSFSDLVLI